MSEDTRNEEEWLEILGDWEGSYLSQPEYCKSKGIDLWNFMESRKKLMGQDLKRSRKQRKSKPTPMRFIPVNLSAGDAAPALPAVKEIEQAFIEIQLPHGIVLRIPTC